MLINRLVLDMIRKALDKDISGIIKVVQEAHEKSISKTVPLDVKTLRKNLQVCVLSREHLVMVVDLDDKIEGAFIGVTPSYGTQEKSNRLISFSM